MEIGEKQVKSKGSLPDKDNNSGIDNNNIYTRIPTHNKQTTKVLRVFHPHAPVQFPSPFYVQFIILRNFVIPLKIFQILQVVYFNRPTFW